jgi:hypothetical protein
MSGTANPQSVRLVRRDSGWRPRVNSGHTIMPVHSYDVVLLRRHRFLFVIRC